MRSTTRPFSFMRIRSHACGVFVLLTCLCLLLVLPSRAGAQQHAEPTRETSSLEFPPELVHWRPAQSEPLFAGTGKDTWDRFIRERGYILREGRRWHLWYTGYNPDRSDQKSLGYASSTDGRHWTRHPRNPIFAESWVEDVCVVHHGSLYYMFAEGRNDIAHMLTSPDGLHWKEHGPLDIRRTNGKPISPGPYGTPTVWVEDSTWYLFYERRDRGVWLATSQDRKRWTHVQDEPVLSLGPDAYDRYAIALNQVFRYRGRYYGIYHANADRQWKGPWTTCLAVSDDLVHWKKYPGNPIIGSNDSSGILVDDGQQIRLYTMHPAVKLWLPDTPARR